MQLIVITGLSGAGKGLAARHFEDFGYFCVDNLPPTLIPSFAELLQRGQIGKAALVIDARGGEFFPELLAALDELSASPLELRILFLDCDDDALLKRFKETRRKHPLDDGESGLAAAIAAEREALVPLRERADKVVNTSHVTPRELREEIKKTFVDAEQTPGMLIQIESFGFKHGPPAGADLVFDVRFLPNPNYDREIGHLDGFCQPVIDYVMREPVTAQFLEKWEDLITFLVPQFEKEGKAYLTIAVGCTGGRHRSVALSNWLAEKLRERGFRANATHRDLVRHAPTPAPDLLNERRGNGAQSQTFDASDVVISDDSTKNQAERVESITEENALANGEAI
ncbi:UPF0042 nucleotide-binding protein [Abditibacterium utsteinense]|uniref:UPF0042 nucleotide-binding protein n=1 Tax=Abditibacterium utsteinense TaxID=1960156 RepID=A0A2S8SQN8_9BACT|nr:RNase adapter RapZ [Abditibacterium utsteinense]PQV63122.1 UPF0042 nucleotide-binding protein [Abditibacterium utsteinense]